VIKTLALPISSLPKHRARQSHTSDARDTNRNQAKLSYS